MKSRVELLAKKDELENVYPHLHRELAIIFATKRLKEQQQLNMGEAPVGTLLSQEWDDLVSKFGLADNPDPANSTAPWRVYNIGNNNPVELMDYIRAIENSLGIKAEKELLPLQPGDVPDTYADVDDLVEEFGYKPLMNIEKGVDNFVKWYKEYNNV